MSNRSSLKSGTMIIGDVPSSYTQADLAKVIRLVAEMSPDLECQLSILAHALVLGCKSTDVPKHGMIREFEKLWEGHIVHLPKLGEVSDFGGGKPN